MDGRRAFLHALLDDAGIFPPAELSVADAVARHDRVAAGPEAWMLGRFVTRSTKLTEIDPQSFHAPLSVVIDHVDVHAGFLAVRAAHDRGAAVESVEIPIARGKGASPESRLNDLATQLTGAGLGFAELFAEIPLVELSEITALVCALADVAQEHAVKLNAKIRCGGASVPGPEQIARFLTEASAEAVPFKATAGLHQPIAFREHGLLHHGFINLFGAAIFADNDRLDEEAIGELLGDVDAASFSLDRDSFRWRDATVPAEEIEAVRQSFALSFGTCSLEEPIDGLTDLGLLERSRA